MNVFASRQPAGLNYELQSTNQGTLEGELVDASEIATPPLMRSEVSAFEGIAAGDQGVLTLTLATQADAGSRSQLYLTGTVNVQVLGGEETTIFSFNTLQVEVSFDGGTTWGQLINALTGCTLADDTSRPTPTPSYVFPVSFILDNGGPPTGDVLCRLTLTNSDESSSAVIAPVALNALLF